MSPVTSIVKLVSEVILLPLSVKLSTVNDVRVPRLVIFVCAAVASVPVIVPVNVGLANGALRATASVRVVLN